MSGAAIGLAFAALAISALAVTGGIIAMKKAFSSGDRLVKEIREGATQTVKLGELAQNRDEWKEQAERLERELEDKENELSNQIAARKSVEEDLAKTVEMAASGASAGALADSVRSALSEMSKLPGT